MKSKASIKSHPLHPILVAFPIAFFTGTCVFDLLHLLTDNGQFGITAKMLSIGGVGFALLAAVPGIVDYVYTVPPDSSGKKRAAKHGLTNISVLILFSIALYFRYNESGSLPTIVGLEVVGLILLMIAGWLGGTLVYRNQIGVDPRYAHAGKWKEQEVEMTSGNVVVASMDELKVNQMKLIRVGDKRIVLGRTEEGYKAFDDRCTHRGGSLAGGVMICGTVQCPWHGSQFNVNDGSVSAGPAAQRIATYTVTQADGKVLLSL